MFSWSAHVVSFRGNYLAFRFKAKESLQHCVDFFFDILITSKGASALGMFKYISKFK